VLRRDQLLQQVTDHCSIATDELNNVKAKVKLIHGSSEENSIKIPETKIQSVIQLCNAIDPTLSPEIGALINECTHLSWKPLKEQLNKVSLNVRRTAEKLKKKVDVEIVNEQIMWQPNVLKPVDEILLHVVRNALDHGIELPEVRTESGKQSNGKLTIELSEKDSWYELRIEDDGAGIDTDRIARLAASKALISNEKIETLTELEKINLIFLPGFSTAENISDISGRGVGMDIVKTNLLKIEGTIDIKTAIGKGTKLTICWPITKEQL